MSYFPIISVIAAWYSKKNYMNEQDPNSTPEVTDTPERQDAERITRVVESIQEHIQATMSPERYQAAQVLLQMSQEVTDITDQDSMLYDEHVETRREFAQGVQEERFADLLGTPLSVEEAEYHARMQAAMRLMDEDEKSQTPEETEYWQKYIEQRVLLGRYVADATEGACTLEDIDEKSVEIAFEDVRHGTVYVRFTAENGVISAKATVYYSAYESVDVTDTLPDELMGTIKKEVCDALGKYEESP